MTIQANTSVLKPASIRHNNYRTILLTILGNDTCTVADLSEHLNLSKTAVAKAITTLSSLDFIVNAGKGTSTATGGKPPERYRINPECRYTCSISYYHDLIVLHIHNFIGEEILQTSFSVPSPSYATLDTYLEICTDWIRQAFSMCQRDLHKLCGIVFLSKFDSDNPDTNAFLFAQIESSKTFQDRLAEELGIPPCIYIEHPKDMRGYAELHHNPDRRNQLIVIISILREEISGCILDKGNILQGASGRAANFAHITTDYSMRNTCTCGKRGCFASTSLRNVILKDLSAELKAGTPSVLQQPYKNHSLSMDDWIKAAEEGDELATRHMNLNLENYIHLISEIDSMLNPDEIIFQMGLSGADYHQQELNKRFRETMLPFHPAEDIMKISGGHYEPFPATAIGAAHYCIDNYLDNPSCFEQ